MVEALGQRLGFLEIHVRDVYQPEFVMLVVMTVEHPRVCKFYNHVSFFSSPSPLPHSEILFPGWLGPTPARRRRTPKKSLLARHIGAGAEKMGLPMTTGKRNFFWGEGLVSWFKNVCFVL